MNNIDSLIAKYSYTYECHKNHELEFEVVKQELQVYLHSVISVASVDLVD